jgi:hypothetical protein
MRAEQGPHMMMPLLRLAPPPDEARDDTRDATPDITGRIDGGPAPRIPRLLDLDDPTDTGLAAWVVRIREASEACLVIDRTGRVAAMSGCGGQLLSVDPVAAVGVLLLDLVVLVDFTSTGIPIADPDLQLPPLRALKSGGMARGLVRLRRPHGGLGTYDIVGVPLTGRVGALAFLVEV